MVSFWTERFNLVQYHFTYTWNELGYLIFRRKAIQVIIIQIKRHVDRGLQRWMVSCVSLSGIGVPPGVLSESLSQRISCQARLLVCLSGVAARLGWLLAFPEQPSLPPNSYPLWGKLVSS